MDFNSYLQTSDFSFLFFGSPFFIFTFIFYACCCIREYHKMLSCSCPVDWKTLAFKPIFVRPKWDLLGNQYWIIFGTVAVLCPQNMSGRSNIVNRPGFRFHTMTKNLVNRTVDRFQTNAHIAETCWALIWIHPFSWKSMLFFPCLWEIVAEYQEPSKSVSIKNIQRLFFLFLYPFKDDFWKVLEWLNLLY